MTTKNNRGTDLADEDLKQLLWLYSVKSRKIRLLSTKELKNQHIKMIQVTKWSFYKMENYVMCKASGLVSELGYKLVSLGV